MKTHVSHRFPGTGTRTPTAPRSATPAWLATALAALVCCTATAQTSAPPAPAPVSTATAERAQLEQLKATTLALIEALVSQGLLTRERADALLRQAQPQAAEGAVPWGTPAQGAAASGAGKTIRVPYIPETLKNQLREEVKNEVLVLAREERWADPRALPDWVRGLQFSGDLRLRAQSELFDAPRYLQDSSGAAVGGPCDIVGGNLPAECYGQTAGASVAWAPDMVNTTTDRHRLTLRARLGVNARVGDDTSAGLRFTTGGTTGPTSTSQTLGNHFNRYAVTIDRAFLRWEPRYDWRVFGGRMANPFSGSDLLWPDDLAFDGLAVQHERNLLPGLFAYGTAGAFPLEEFNVSSRDKWLFAAQLGADWAFSDNAQLRVGIAAYDFQKVEGVRETNPPPGGSRAGTVPYFTSAYPSSVRLKGNTLINLNDPTSTAAPTWGLASKFKPIHLSALLTVKTFAPVDIGVGLEWVRNTGFDIADIRQRAGTNAVDVVQPRTEGLQLRGTLGMAQPANAGEWQVSAALRKFERDAWIDGFTDTSWHGGGTNYQGWQLGGQVAFDRRATLGLRVTSTRNLDDRVRITNPVTGLQEGLLSSAPLRQDTVQIDLNTRF